MAVLRPPYYYLQGLLKILIIDDEPGVRNLFKDTFAAIPLYTVLTAATVAEAMTVLQGIERMHVVIMDLGMPDADGDEFFLLRKFAPKSTFIIYTGASSSQKGFEAHKRGADAIIEKSGTFDIPGVRRLVNILSLRTAINPLYRKNDQAINRATELLIEKKPQSVQQWSEELGLTDRALRMIWTQKLGANAKIILAIHKIYVDAFMYYNGHLADANQTFDSAAHLSRSHYTRLEETFHLNRSVICDYLAFGNIAIT